MYVNVQLPHRLSHSVFSKKNKTKQKPIQIKPKQNYKKKKSLTLLRESNKDLEASTTDVNSITGCHIQYSGKKQNTNQKQIKPKQNYKKKKNR